MAERPALEEEEFVDEHIASLEPNYIGVFWWLVGLTIAEIMVAVMPTSIMFPKVAQKMALVGLAFGKASLVALYFMHLKFEKRALALFALTPLALCTLLMFALVPDLTATPHRTALKDAPKAAVVEQAAAVQEAAREP